MMNRQFTTTLAEWIGLNEAIFIQHVQDTLESSEAVTADGTRWIRKTLNDYCLDFPFWDRSIIKRTIRNLKLDELILTRSDLNAVGWDRSAWYSIAYENLSTLTGPVNRLKVKGLKRQKARGSRQLDNRPGFVYLCDSKDRTGYKIGLSIDARLRMSQLGANLLHLIPTSDMLRTEQELHRRFADKRLDGEWFDLASDDVAYIQAIGSFTNGDTL